ncbi:hypothetical protein HK098_001045 [Nowakowskiella sp. JEL0407]|nr:hypothetical protein HK098_001045 [Nowakowskiella sp. JEL0407]
MKSSFFLLFSLILPIFATPHHRHEHYHYGDSIGAVCPKFSLDTSNRVKCDLSNLSTGDPYSACIDAGCCYDTPNSSSDDKWCYKPIYGPMKTCRNIDPNDREDCLYTGKIPCANAGCCWSPSPNGPWCYTSKNSGHFSPSPSPRTSPKRSPSPSPGRSPSPSLSRSPSPSPNRSPSPKPSNGKANYYCSNYPLPYQDRVVGVVSSGINVFVLLMVHQAVQTLIRELEPVAAAEIITETLVRMLVVAGCPMPTAVFPTVTNQDESGV